jgi:hypothetical protein
MTAFLFKAKVCSYFVAGASAGGVSVADAATGAAGSVVAAGAGAFFSHLPFAFKHSFLVFSTTAPSSTQLWFCAGGGVAAFLAKAVDDNNARATAKTIFFMVISYY